ncbi:GNAT family N-acetyltransferase [Actinoplanes oblitus]|uniref:GNAT family N-acetyltransferase n=1 Tax=Actinoplanes oblitus TaxID=3040509 RepID=A0ABY8W878_9ACTN|nr:GNAT family N-acetyltransferase [Actinoplanes oblitus]WIM92623.1 GNAT family N-acetyltransferase [Actinoplanes oblitus]
MSDRAVPGLTLRTAVPSDLPGLRHVYRTASLSNAGDAPMLLARPEFLHFAGDGVAAGRTVAALAGPPGEGRIVGFATVVAGPDGELELDDLFVDPGWQRRGIARRLVAWIAGTARAAGHRRLWVTGNPHALAFYRAAGFAEVGRIGTELGEGLRMSLDLTR